MKLIIIIIITLILISLFFIPVNANNIKMVNIQIKEHSEKISHKFNMTTKVLKSDYYKCLDIYSCNDEYVCKNWCYDNYK